MIIWPSDLAERKTAIGSELYASLYFSEEKRKVIVAPVFEVTGGLYQEQEKPIVLPFDAPDEDIAHQAKLALLAFKRSARGIQKIDASVWPAYQASKMKSRKEFSAYYQRIWIETIGANLRIEASDIGIEDLFVGAYLAPAVDDAKLGETLYHIYKCCRQLASVDFQI